MAVSTRKKKAASTKATASLQVEAKRLGISTKALMERLRADTNGVANPALHPTKMPMATEARPRSGVPNPEILTMIFPGLQK